MKARDHRSAPGAAHPRLNPKSQSQLIAFNGSAFRLSDFYGAEAHLEQKYLSFVSVFVLVTVVMQNKLVGKVFWLYAECHILLDRQQ